MHEFHMTEMIWNWFPIKLLSRMNVWSNWWFIKCFRITGSIISNEWATNSSSWCIAMEPHRSTCVCSFMCRVVVTFQTDEDDDPSVFFMLEFQSPTFRYLIRRSQLLNAADHNLIYLSDFFPHVFLEMLQQVMEWMCIWWGARHAGSYRKRHIPQKLISSC